MTLEDHCQYFGLEAGGRRAGEFVELLAERIEDLLRVHCRGRSRKHLSLGADPHLPRVSIVITL